MEKLIDGVPILEKPADPGTVGLVDVPSIGGGSLAYFVCASKGGANTPCIPSTVEWRGQLVFGPCYCFHEEFDGGPPQVKPCSFNLLSCVELKPCRSGLRCGYVRQPFSPTVVGGPSNVLMLTCECTR